MLALTSMSCWGYSLFFCLGFKRTGPFVVMIFHMVMNDIVTFLIIESVFLLSFAASFVCLNGDGGLVSFLGQVNYFFAVM
eukprot:SAG11_NODE_338_length_10535_cov_8.199885_4_plen_80_part_00